MTCLDCRWCHKEEVVEEPDILSYERYWCFNPQFVRELEQNPVTDNRDIRTPLCSDVRLWHPDCPEYEEQRSFLRRLFDGILLGQGEEPANQ